MCDGIRLYIYEYSKVLDYTYMNIQWYCIIDS